MTYTQTRLTVFFILGLIFPFTIHAQYNPQFFQNGTSSTTLAEVKTNDADTGTITFVLLGDGRFRLGEGNTITRQHNYPAASTNYTAKAFFVKKYKSDPPTARTTTVTTGSGSSSFANPEVQMTACVKVGTSWSPTPSNEFYTILSFTNNCSTTKVSGKIRYYFNTSEQTLSTGSSDLLIYNSWISGATIKTSDDTAYGYMLEADYTDLDLGEIRHIYVRTEVPSSVSVGSTLKYKFMATGLGCCNNSSTAGTIEASGYPHDPNKKIVDKDRVCAKNKMPHELTYTISFHNDGDNFAQDIFVTDTFEPKLVPNTVSLRGSSAACVLIPNYPAVTFHFPGIFLPGLNQTSPQLYTYEETIGFLTFSINTITCLPHNISILNQASIVFDAQPPVQTTIAETITDESTCLIPCAPTPFIKSNQDDLSFNSQPNPFFNDLTLRFTAANPWDIQIFDQQGRQVFHQSGLGAPGNQQHLEINGSDWSKGVYFIRLKDGELYQSSKMIKM